MKNILKNKKGISTPMIALIVVLMVVAVTVIGVISLSNSIISLGIQADQEWSEVRNQYQRQADLIPNLVSTTKGYMQFEASLFTNLTALQTEWQQAVGNEYQEDVVGTEIRSVIGQFLVTYTNYPELHSDQAIQTLMDELAGTQNRITVARGRYIDAIGAYNIAVRTFPGSILNYPPKQFYQGSTGIENPPTVTFP